MHIDFRGFIVKALIFYFFCKGKLGKTSLKKMRLKIRLYCTCN